MNLQLIPFERTFGPKILEWNLDPTARRFWRGVNRYLTLEECENLPKVIGLEVLGILSEDGLIGLIEFGDEGPHSTRFAMLIDREHRGKGVCRAALPLTEEYAFQVKSIKFLKTECSKEDDLAQKTLIKRNFVKIGEIPEYCFNNGKHEDAVLFYKVRQPWVF